MLPTLVLLLPRVSAASSPMPTGTEQVDARFALALYCNPTCDDSVLDALERDLSAIPAVEGFGELADAPGRMMGLADTTASPYGKDGGFEVPDADYLASFGTGVDRPDELARSESVVLAWFVAPRDQALATLSTAHLAFANAALASSGWVEDLDTQGVYGQAAWAAKDPTGPLTEWFVVDNNPATDTPEGELRLVTRGLRRLGDRDLVLDHVPADSGGDAAYVLNAVAVALHARPDVPATLVLDSADARGTATLVAVDAVDGDPGAPLVQVTFKGQLLAAASLGSEPEPSAEVAPTPPVTPAPEPTPTAAITAGFPRPNTLAEAQEAARARLASVVRSAYGDGLPPGEKLAVSVPFPNPDGTREYLWVEVRGWRGSIISGVVATTPAKTRAVVAGQSVTVDQAQVFDYVWKKADGTREGNTTAAFLN